jgi:hypothetical protein
MASYLTRIKPDQQYQSQIAYEPIAFALASRQKRYDHEFAKVEAFAQSMGSLDLAKPEDAAYYQENLKYVMNQINEGGTGDLSLVGAGKVMSYIGGAADDKVTNAYIGTRQTRALQDGWDKLREDDPSSFNQDNYDYSMQNINSWMSDGKVGSKLSSYSNARTGSGAGEVTAYINPLDKANALIKTLTPEGYVEWSPSGQFEFFEKKGVKLTDTRITQQMETMLMGDPQVRQQIEINAWAKYRGLDDETFAENYKGIYEGQVAQYDKAIEETSNKLAVTGNKADRAQLQETLSYLKAKKKETGDFVGDLTNEKIIGQRVGIENSLYTNEFIQGIADAYKFDSVKSMGFKISQEGMARWKDGQEWARHNEKMQQDRQKIAQEQQSEYYKVLKEYADEGTPEGVKLVLRQQLSSMNPHQPGSAQAAAFEAGIDGYLNVEAKSSVDTKEMKEEMQAAQIQLKEAELKNQTDTELVNFIRNNVKKELHGDYLEADGSLKGVDIFGATSAFMTGELEEILDPTVDMTTAKSQFSQITSLHNSYKYLADLTALTRAVSTDNLRGDLTKVLEKKKVAKLGSSGYGIILEPGEVVGTSFWDKVLDGDAVYAIKTDEEGNQLYDGEGNLQIVERVHTSRSYATWKPAFTEREDVIQGDGRWEATKRFFNPKLEAPTMSFKSSEDFVDYLATIGNKKIVEGYSNIFKDMYGDVVQGTEMSLTGIGNQSRILMDAVLMSNMPQSMKDKFSSPEAVDVFFKGQTNSSGGTKTYIPPPAVKIWTNPAAGRGYITIGDESFTVNTGKIPNSPASDFIEGSLRTSNILLKSNSDKTKDLKDFKANKHVPYTKTTTYPSINMGTEEAPTYFDIDMRVVDKSTSQSADIGYKPVFKLRGEVNASKEVPLLQFDTPLEYENFIENDGIVMFYFKKTFPNYSE